MLRNAGQRDSGASRANAVLARGADRPERVLVLVSSVALGCVRTEKARGQWQRCVGPAVDPLLVLPLARRDTGQGISD